ncbi:hypothetical protein RB195_024856 [Necator americanus]|uniref:Secreted protein n=1 Tax=Necator americanus TaxID=51031 RepID=A0ABR1EQG3_NECAM
MIFSIRLLNAMVVPFGFGEQSSCDWRSLDGHNGCFSSAALAYTSALLSLRSSFIASLQSLESSTLAYQLKILKRQASFGGFKTLNLLRAVVKVFNEPVVFLVAKLRNLPRSGQA